MKYLSKFNESIITNGHNITMKQWDGYVATVEDFEILGELLQSEVFDEYDIYRNRENNVSWIREAGESKFWLIEESYDFDGLNRHILISVNKQFFESLFKELKDISPRIKDQLGITYLVNRSILNNCITIKINKNEN